MKANATGRLLLGLGLFLAATAAQAQATRTWVSGVGDDANPCSRTAPCKTFAGAISKTLAGGIISVLDPGGFGAVTITKSITIDGGGIEASILASGTYGVTVNAAATDVVTLRNLRISGQPGTGLAGVRYLAAAAVHIEDCRIEAFRSTSAGWGWGIIATPSGAGERRLYVKNTTIQDSGSSTTGGAVSLAPAGGGFINAVFTDSQIANNLGHGLRLADNTHTTIEGTNISGNRKSGVFAVSSSLSNVTDVVVRNSVISDSGTEGGAAVTSSGTNTFVSLANNVIANNGLALNMVSSGTIRSYGDNQVLNNTTNGVPNAAGSEL
jgi:hypothetical protein